MAGSIPSDLIFRGGDGDECDEFVLAVNQWAFENDKDEDDRWVARLASSCLAGDAMRFYDTLDEEVQKSWRLLRRALFTRYSSSGANAPSPAAAVLRPFSETGPGDFRTGMIRVTVQGETKQRYLSHAVENSGSHCPFVAKKDVSAALHVKLRRSLDLQPIRIMVKPRRLAWLGLVQATGQPCPCSRGLRKICMLPGQCHRAVSNLEWARGVDDLEVQPFDRLIRCVLVRRCRRPYFTKGPRDGLRAEKWIYTPIQ